MADIRIEKKRKVWPWLLLIIVLAVLAFLYFYGSMENEETDDLETTEIDEVSYVRPQIVLQMNEEGII